MSATTLGRSPIPITRLDQADPALVEELLEVVSKVAWKGAFSMGVELDAFEEEFAAYCGAAHAVGVSSGTEALALALRVLDIGAGDEVIVPANSFIASAEAVSLAGATPRLVDVDPETHLLTAEAVEAAIGPRTRAVIPVHLMGATVDLDPILEVARAAGLRVIEDTAQAHGAFHRGRRVGTLGDIGCFSFYPTKNLGGWGDGGAVVTGDAELADRVRLLRSHGERPRYHHQVVGTTARLDALQAAILRVKLRRLDGWNDDRRRLGAALREGLTGTAVELPTAAFEGADHVYHLFIVRSDKRDALREHLAQHDVATAVHYPFPIHRTGAYAGLGLGPGSLPVAERLCEQICTLPLFPTMSDDEVARIVAAVESFEL
ncbi:MAG: DegT/DnrJ/EryC1/StrS family aminotransferase [Candidatus Limnocylindria bacterium]